MVAVLLAEGFEEVEALTPVDLLRRAGVPTVLLGVTEKTVRGARGITVVADGLLAEFDLQQTDMLVLPGGMPGTRNLYEDARVKQAVSDCVQADKWIAAICAAPSVVLGGMGLLAGKKATCYPGMEHGMTGALPQNAPCVVDGRFITARGVGAALSFSCALITALCGAQKAREIAADVVYDD